MDDFWSVVSEKNLRIGKKLHKITHYSMENMGNTPILTSLVGVLPRNIHTKFEANLWIGLKEYSNMHVT